ncbi:hypothetical protein JZ751_026283 [Albula glossodonta]|uniref:Uncharacterized protein n=1 Tax=Albula glossodonta TaxID=121402 RepID=A0A8T2PD13_9TELE|nr:hypothetical protein JZ751_026283 [Albula glossodonta]
MVLTEQGLESVAVRGMAEWGCGGVGCDCERHGRGAWLHLRTLLVLVLHNDCRLSPLISSTLPSVTSSRLEVLLPLAVLSTCCSESDLWNGPPITIRLAASLGLGCNLPQSLTVQPRVCDRKKEEDRTTVPIRTTSLTPSPSSQLVGMRQQAAFAFQPKSFQATLCPVEFWGQRPLPQCVSIGPCHR